MMQCSTAKIPKRAQDQLDVLLKFQLIVNDVKSCNASQELEPTLNENASI